MRKLAKRLKTPLFLALAVLLVAFISRLVMPKRYEYGANWEAFHREASDSMDVVFFGSSMVYCNVIPAVIWEHTGLHVYDMAGPTQTAACTYYYVEEMFRTQSPSAVMVEVSDIHYDAETGLEETKINLGYLPYDATRWRATLACAPREDWATLFFPPWAYHVRWPELTQDDFAFALRGYDADKLAGYTFVDKIKPQPGRKERSFEQTEAEYQTNLGWYLKIRDLCARKNCRCIFYISASCADFPADYLARMRADLTATGAEFFNSMDEFDRIGLDFDSDFYGVIHFNCRGAEKNSVYLGQKLLDMGVRPRDPDADREAWTQKLEYYRSIRPE